MGAKSNASTTGKHGTRFKDYDRFRMEMFHCSYTNEEDMLRAFFGDADEGGQTCIMCCNLRLPSSDEDLLARK
jgi:hypothetical protein